MSDEDLKAELERLRNENEALKKGASSSIRMKVSEKGAVSIYGMGRFPVTLYKASSRSRVGDYQPISINCLLLLLTLWACGQRACVVHHVHGVAARLH